MTAVSMSRVANSIPNAFPEAIGSIPNNPLIAAALAAILKGGEAAVMLSGGWTEDDEGRLVYRHIGKRGGEIHVHIDGPEGETGDPEAQWAEIEALSPLTADVLMAVLAQFCEPGQGQKSKYPLLLPTAISANTILRYKSITRWGREREALRARVAEEIARLQRLSIDVHQFPAWEPSQRRWNPRGVSVIGDRLFQVVERSLRGSMAMESSQTLWLTRAGQWSQWWFNAQAKVWTGPVPLSLLQLDHRKNRGAATLAKKIGFSTMVLWGAARSRLVLERRIDHLLEDVGELPLPPYRSSHWAGRVRDRFDEALLQLQDIGVFAQVDWPERFAPGARDRSKGWTEPWLASKVRFFHPRAAELDASELELRTSAPPRTARRRRRSRSIEVAKHVSGSEIRSLRVDRSLSQVQLARALGISPTYLSQIENEKRNISETLARRIVDWSQARQAA